MKNDKADPSGSRTPTWGLLAITAAGLLWWALPANAGTKVTVAQTVIHYAILDPGEVTTPDSQLHLRGESGWDIVLCDDPRGAGQTTWIVDAYVDAEGNVIYHGSFDVQVGTWDLSVPSNPKFTPTGGVWVGTIRGQITAEGVETYDCVGHGVGGEIDGQQVIAHGEGSGGVALQTCRILDPHGKN